MGFLRNDYLTAVINLSSHFLQMCCYPSHVMLFVSSNGVEYQIRCNMLQDRSNLLLEKNRITKAN